ncbi:MAG: RNA polymerase subunit sigma-70 [Planctomycetes bacterium]|nr:RNA polymerase subunit sigma-70 [Planctomycetota bacterium]
MDRETPPPSVSRWLVALKEGDSEAASALWRQYFDRLVRLARQKLGAAPRRAADEEDVALSVFRCLCDGAARGRFPELTDRDDLWRLLTTMTIRKAIDQKRRGAGLKRGAGLVRGESVFADLANETAGLDQALGDEPTPEWLAMLAEEHTRLLDALGNETLRQVALWKMEGFTNEEIAEKLGLTCRSVERKLERIRSKWTQDAAT